jgi:hypothetical protein
MIKSKRGKTWMLVGKTKEPSKPNVDILLSDIPWVEVAIHRAQSNLIDFNFKKIPCLTAEDIIISKLYSLKNRSDRFQDLDDIKEIFIAQKNLDTTYVSDRMIEFKLLIPSALKNLVPKELFQTSKLIKRLP